MAKCQTYFGVIMVLLVVFLVSMATPQPVVEETSDGDQINRWMHSKRPFCNAFAGNYLCNNQLVQLNKSTPRLLYILLYCVADKTNISLLKKQIATDG